MYLAKISAKDNLCGKKLIYEEALVDSWTIYVAKSSKKSGSRGPLRTIFLAKSLPRDTFSGNLH